MKDIMATLRGSQSNSLFAIAETLKLALKSAANEAELRENIRSVIKLVEKWKKVNGRPYPKNNKLK